MKREADGGDSMLVYVVSMYNKDNMMMYEVCVCIFMCMHAYYVCCNI